MSRIGWIIEPKKFIKILIACPNKNIKAQPIKVKTPFTTEPESNTPNARSSKTAASTDPDIPNAKRRTYDKTSPKRPVAILYVSQRPEPIFSNRFFILKNGLLSGQLNRNIQMPAIDANSR